MRKKWYLLKKNVVKGGSYLRNWRMGKIFLPTTSLKLGSDLGTVTILGWIILSCGGFLSVLGCLAASLALSAGCHQHFPNCSKTVFQNCLWTLLNVPWEDKIAPTWAPLIKTEYSSVLWRMLCFPASIALLTSGTCTSPASCPNSTAGLQGQAPVPPPSCVFPVERASSSQIPKALYLYVLYDSECQLSTRSVLYDPHNHSMRKTSLLIYRLGSQGSETLCNVFKVT